MLDAEPRAGIDHQNYRQPSREPTAHLSFPKNHPYYETYHFQPPSLTPTGASRSRPELLDEFDKNKADQAAELPSTENYTVEAHFPASCLVVRKCGKRTRYNGELFRTKNHHEWLVVPPPSETKLRLRQKPFVLNGTAKELYARQDPEPLEQNAAANSETQHFNTPTDHDAIGLFFLSAWDEIVPSLYEDEIPVEEVPKELPRMREVFLNDYQLQFDYLKPRAKPHAHKEWRPKKSKKQLQDLKAKGKQFKDIYLAPPTCGQIDIVGQAPDRVVVVDFGGVSGSKVKQVVKQELGLEQLLRDKNDPKDDPPEVATYIGEYFTDQQRRPRPLHVVKLVPISGELIHEI